LKRGFSLAEVLVSSALLLVIGLVTTILYGNAIGTIQFTTSRSDTKQILRQALNRLAPLLQTAYIPSLAGANGCYENPLAPYPAGVDAADPLAAKGPGCNSFLFYTPVDLLDQQALAAPPDSQTIHLFEIRLQESLEVDSTQNGGPPLTLRTLVLQERGLPASFGMPPFPLINGRIRVLARRLSDLRFTRLSGYGLQLRLEAQSRQRTLASAGATVFTNRLDSKVYFPVLVN
jgi:prepilin-type N-terminal cleavage/methylation domain-containing protein